MSVNRFQSILGVPTRADSSLWFDFVPPQGLVKTEKGPASQAQDRYVENRGSVETHLDRFQSLLRGELNRSKKI